MSRLVTLQKSIIYPFLFLYCSIGHAQYGKDKLIGIWQADFAEVTSMFKDTYQFFPDGRFIFRPDAYNGLTRIVSIIGRYELEGHILFLIPDSTEEIVGGYLERSKETTLSDSWEIIDGKNKKIACKNKEKQLVNISFTDDGAILLDSRKYFIIKQ